MARTRGAREPGKCIFCGRSGVTKEHLFADWLKELFPRSPADTHTFGEVQFTPERTVTAKRRQGHSGSKKIRKVCQQCNNGWVNHLDDAAKSVLVPMVRGETDSVTPAMQAALSTWLVKIAMVGDANRRARSKVTQAERDWLMRQKSPPPLWHVWLGRYGGDTWASLGIHQHGGNLAAPPVPSPMPFKGYVQTTMLEIGNVLALVVATDISVIGFEIGEAALLMKRIYPAPTELRWTDGHVIADDQASRIALILERMLMHPLQGDPHVTEP